MMILNIAPMDIAQYLKNKIKQFDKKTLLNLASLRVKHREAPKIVGNTGLRMSSLWNKFKVNGKRFNAGMYLT